ncbi:MAG: hypothetical protein K0S26_1402 [Bacteroidota bacterium]|jgi:hypothetical protein|nr:hypothetical protein [Bacteroidota bacterium]
MKHLTILLPFSLLLSCSEPVAVEQPKPEEPTAVFNKYPTVMEMLIDAHDYSEEQGTLKMLSKKEEPLHIQVSKQIFDGDLEKEILDQTKRDIVYVAFQAFAQTDINELTITSVPLKSNGKLADKYKLITTINRETAKNILKKYVSTGNFQDLFQFDGTLWLPNKNFDNLKFNNLDAVYTDMTNKEIINHSEDNKHG